MPGLTGEETQVNQKLCSIFMLRKSQCVLGGQFLGKLQMGKNIQCETEEEEEEQKVEEKKGEEGEEQEEAGEGQIKQGKVKHTGPT